MTAMHWGRDNTRRLRELAARIAAEQDHDKFTALVKEFNELVDGKQPLKESPKDQGAGKVMPCEEGDAWHV